MKQPGKQGALGLQQLLLIMLAWSIVFTLSCWLSHATAASIEAHAGKSVTGLFLGEGRSALSDYFYQNAELYFHGGWEHMKTEAFNNSIFQKVTAEISPRRHIHVEGREVREIMPWFKLAVMMNPSDVRIYLDAAFCLGYEAERPDLAENILQEAQVNNPFNYQVQLERGRLFLKEKKIQQARSAFDAGLAFWPGKEPPDDDVTRDGKARLLMYRALIYEAEEKRQDAITCLREIIRMFPERTAIADRIKTLEEGKEPSLLVSRVWSDMLKHDADSKNNDQCKHHGEE